VGQRLLVADVEHDSNRVRDHVRDPADPASPGHKTFDKERRRLSIVIELEVVSSGVKVVALEYKTVKLRVGKMLHDRLEDIKFDRE
jgi:hypothetical protein